MTPEPWILNHAPTVSSSTPLEIMTLVTLSSSFALPDRSVGCWVGGWVGGCECLERIVPSWMLGCGCWFSPHGSVQAGLLASSLKVCRGLNAIMEDVFVVETVRGGPLVSAVAAVAFMEDAARNTVCGNGPLAGRFVYRAPVHTRAHTHTRARTRAHAI